MKCSSPFVKKINGKDMRLPCGQCLYCRIQHAREWSVRLINESQYWDDCCFVTLTFDDDHIGDNNLSIDEMQRFFKRLRKDLGKKKIKYFACGEYGDKTQRKHYHAIIFGLGPQHKDIIYRNWLKCVPERCQVGTVTPDSVKYVAQYVLKKYNNKKAFLMYGGRRPPFSSLFARFRQAICSRLCRAN